MTASHPVFSSSSPMVLFGMGMYIVNRLADTYLNIPIGDLFLPLFTLFFLWREKNTLGFLKSPGAFLVIALLGWMTLSNFANGISLGGQFRNSFAVITLFFPVLCFAAVKDRQSLMAYMIGMVIGFGLYFSVLMGLAVAGGAIPRGLRGEQLTPVVPLAFYILFRNQLARSLRWALLFFTAVSIFATFAIDVRAPLVALILSAALFVAMRFSPKPAFVLTTVLAAGLLVHFGFSFFIPDSFDTVYNTGTDSISNLERAYAIDYCNMVLAHAPWFGDSPQGYAINFADNFAAIASFADVGDNIASPHNSFYEYAVFFGYPGGLLFVLILCRLFYVGVSAATLARGLFAALVCAGLIRIGAFYGFSGWLRAEWFALAFALFYANSRTGEEPAATPAKP